MADVNKTPENETEAFNKPPAPPADVLKPELLTEGASLLEDAPSGTGSNTATGSTVTQPGTILELPGMPPEGVLKDIPPVVEPPKGECNCAVKEKGRGRHAQTCPRFTPNKPKVSDATEANKTSPSNVADFINPTANGVKVDFTALGAITFDTITASLALALGPEWMPRPATKEMDERAMLISGIAKYYESQDIKDIPPGVMLTCLIGMYALPRFTQPSTKGKLINAWLWAKDKFFTRKKKNPFVPNIAA